MPQQDFVKALREMNITPHEAKNNRDRSSAIDGRTTGHASYRVSQAKRYWVEKSFGWMKAVGALEEGQVSRPREAMGRWLFTFHRRGVQSVADSQDAIGRIIKPPRPPNRLNACFALRVTPLRFP